jgi:hypothetical protein
VPSDLQAIILRDYDLGLVAYAGGFVRIRQSATSAAVVPTSPSVFLLLGIITYATVPSFILAIKEQKSDSNPGCRLVGGCDAPTSTLCRWWLGLLRLRDLHRTPSMSTVLDHPKPLLLWRDAGQPAFVQFTNSVHAMQPLVLVFLDLSRSRIEPT